MAVNVCVFGYSAASLVGDGAGLGCGERAQVASSAQPGMIRCERRLAYDGGGNCGKSGKREEGLELHDGRGLRDSRNAG